MPEKKSKKDKKPLRAVSLQYEPGSDYAPRVTASGAGRIAERIIEIAEEHGIPITKDPDLVTILSKIEIGSMISPALYDVVAELMVFVYKIKQAWQRKHGDPPYQ